MKFSAVELQLACIKVLKEHIGAAAPFVAEEAIAQYMVESLANKSLVEDNSDFVPWLFFSILLKKLPPSLPRNDIEAAIARAYQ